MESMQDQDVWQINSASLKILRTIPKLKLNLEKWF